jgi:tetratricopeptide (TPR) repeat protein
MDTIALNNNAVDLMRQGNLQGVTSDFRSALGKLHREDVDLADKVTSTFLSVRSVPLEGSLFHTPSSYQDHHAFALFDRGLVIDDADLATASSIAGQNCMSAVVLFNTGLALYLEGRRDIHSRQTCFKKALRFYKMAVEILESASDSNDEVNCLVYLAAMNNMGHIYSHFCERREAQHCLQLIQSMLETVHSSAIDFQSDEYLPFYMNVLILRGQADAAAAAA